MWIKYAIATLGFYFAAVLQNSYFAHFSLCNANLSLFFILFFTLIFFDDSKNISPIFFYSIVAGFLADASMDLYFGTTILSLIITGLLFKKLKESLHKKDKQYPLSYFLTTFIFFYLFFTIMSVAISSSIDKEALNFILNVSIVRTLVCNVIVAIIFYFVYKNTILSDI